MENSRTIVDSDSLGYENNCIFVHSGWLPVCCHIEAPQGAGKAKNSPEKQEERGKDSDI
jgi:L-asparaginase II